MPLNRQIMPTRIFLLGTLWFSFCPLGKCDEPDCFPTKVKVGPETTVVSSPLREDGTVDYIKSIDALYSKGATTDNNAAVILVQILNAEIYGDLKDETISRLGLLEFNDDGPFFITIDDYLGKRNLDNEVAQRINNAYVYAMDYPWDANELPEIAHLLKVNEVHLDQFVAASKKSKLYCPLIQADSRKLANSVSLPVLQELRGVVRMVKCRAMERCYRGDAEGAMRDAMAILRFAYLCEDHPFMVGFLVSNALHSIGTETVFEVLNTNQLNIKQVAKYKKEHASLAGHVSCLHSYDRGERFICLDSVTSYYRGTPSTTFRIPESISQSDGLDINIVLKTFNDQYDELVKAMKMVDRIRQTQVLEEFYDDMVEQAKSDAGVLKNPRDRNVKELSESFSNVIFSLTIPSYKTAIRMEGRYRVRDDLLRVIFALAEYRTVHDNYPTELISLVPAYLDSLPDDLFGDGPFKYKLTKSGAYLLYSVGENGADDGGAQDYQNDRADISYGAIPELLAPNTK